MNLPRRPTRVPANTRSLATDLHNVEAKVSTRFLRTVAPTSSGTGNRNGERGLATSGTLNTERR